MAVAVPVVLVLLWLVDAGFAGFRAATGRNARIDKRVYHLVAAGRGLAVGAAGLGVVAVPALVALAGAADVGARYDGLVGAGVRMLQVLLPFAGLLAAALPAYWLLPMRESAFVVLVGLGPFTLVRPVVVVAAAGWAAAGSGDWLVWAVAVAAAVGVLVVEPVVHRRWYRVPVRGLRA
ncbi:oxidoreductase [Saccharothrix syringae]|uniref:Oxidoreductase n=1 Tax=Saccharothrix syringae TaxID=103733 RepID=A0A5Q0HFU2_SACSY|nr:oxidoreductase [Saccharothrix syringae]